MFQRIPLPLPVEGYSPLSRYLREAYPFQRIPLPLPVEGSPPGSFGGPGWRTRFNESPYRYQ